MVGARTTRHAALTAGSPGPIPVELLSRTGRALRMAVGGKAARAVRLTHAGRRA